MSKRSKSSKPPSGVEGRLRRLRHDPVPRLYLSRNPLWKTVRDVRSRWLSQFCFESSIGRRTELDPHLVGHKLLLVLERFRATHGGTRGRSWRILNEVGPVPVLVLYHFDEDFEVLGAQIIPL